MARGPDDIMPACPCFWPPSILYTVLCCTVYTPFVTYLYDFTPFRLTLSVLLYTFVGWEVENILGSHSPFIVIPFLLPASLEYPQLY